ncbi:hypothetical protein QBC34DRAFT_441124 [Podospora aff. communis PSN243]|uniref:Uncharacterized protein n=1 Tax=Podospora aff. communis PSN243 TaxID=3040156 RepID=A0AAV9GDY0_9PEZI|nr:hypothetical protein QBC34DRAFT_441124 [Podospora aff. communis PSN243]
MEILDRLDQLLGKKVTIIIFTDSVNVLERMMSMQCKVSSGVGLTTPADRRNAVMRQVMLEALEIIHSLSTDLIEVLGVDIDLQYEWLPSHYKVDILRVKSHELANQTAKEAWKSRESFIRDQHGKTVVDDSTGLSFAIRQRLETGFSQAYLSQLGSGTTAGGAFTAAPGTALAPAEPTPGAETLEGPAALTADTGADEKLSPAISAKTAPEEDVEVQRNRDFDKPAPSKCPVRGIEALDEIPIRSGNETAAKSAYDIALEEAAQRWSTVPLSEECKRLAEKAGPNSMLLKFAGQLQKWDAIIEGWREVSEGAMALTASIEARASESCDVTLASVEKPRKPTPTRVEEAKMLEERALRVMEEQREMNRQMDAFEERRRARATGFPVL